jgi:hypothetical protein
MLLTAVSIAGSLKALSDLSRNATCRAVFDFDLSNSKDPSYKKKLLSVVQSMAMSEHSKIVISEKMKKFFDHSPFDELWSTSDERELLIDCFHSQLRIHNTNQLEMGEHTLDFAPPDQPFWYAKTIGSGLCPFASLFNHSCDSNVKRVTVDNKIVFVVGKPIKIGEQLFISYGYSFYRMPREERQRNLEKFSFTCDCIACLEDYPESEDLPRFDDEFVEPKFDSMTMSNAIVEYKKNCKYITENIKRHRCYETSKLLVHNDHLMHQIAKVTFD